jgi:hypothetical protein
MRSLPGIKNSAEGGTLLENSVSVSFLVTKSDYADFKTAAAKACMKKGLLNGLRGAGCAIVFAALVLRAFFSAGFTQNVLYTLIAVAGVLVGVFCDVMIHSFARWRAFAYYEANRERFTAQNAGFGEQSVQISTDRYRADIPYEFLNSAYEDAKVFLLYTGIDEVKFVPKRSMSEDECEQVRAVLKKKLKEKYHQEGAH